MTDNKKMLDKILISNIEKIFTVEKDPFPYAIIKNFLPTEIAKKAEREFIEYNKTVDAGNIRYQKTKMYTENYTNMPATIKQIIDFLYSKEFIQLLEKKFNLKDVEADWSFHGGGMHESSRGGFLKIHSDFLYMRKSKLKRVLNILLYLNSNWEDSWGGSIELWDNQMKSIRKSLLPKINNVIVFRTDTVSNHGFPEPIACPQNVKRKSIALYYYVKDKTLFPISIRRRKYYHAVWKKRPNIDEPYFCDQSNFFKRLKHRFFYRFF